jgi:hypothetical protein
VTVMGGRGWLGVALTLVIAICATSCNRTAELAPASPASRPIAITPDYLRHLALDATVKGHPVRVVSLYANAPDYKPTGSPERDGYEGIASVDDAARAAVAYLHYYDSHADTTARDEALGLLSFVSGMEQGDGKFLNFIAANGTPNRTAPSSRKSMSYWAARSIWALGEATRILGADSPPQLTSMRPVLDRALARMAHDIRVGHLLGGSVTATSEALLGVLALQRASPSADNAALATKTAELLARQSAGSPQRPPWGAYTDSSTAEWHAWGSRAVESLALAGTILRRPDLTVAARKEADGLWSRFLLAGQVPASVSADGSVKWFPQIAYGIGPIVEGYLALADATGDRSYAVLAGLAASWFNGDNVAHTAMYDPATGRTFDGIDGPSPIRINRNAGAESTVEGLLAMESVARDPDAAAYARYRAVAPPSTSLTNLPATREFESPSGAHISIRRGTTGIEIVHSTRTSASASGTAPTPVTLTYWPAANPIEVKLADQLTAQWNAENPDVQVRVQPLPAGRSSEEVLLAAIVARSTPDVSSNVSSALLARLVRANGVVRLDDRIATAARLQERTTPAMLASLRLPDGGIYAFPWKTNPEMLMYNVDLFKAAGVSPPRTQTELLKAMRRLARDTDGDGRIDRWALWAGLKTTWYERFYDFYPLYLASSGGITLVNRCLFIHI